MHTQFYMYLTITIWKRSYWTICFNSWDMYLL